MLRSRMVLGIMLQQKGCNGLAVSVQSDSGVKCWDHFIMERMRHAEERNLYVCVCVCVYTHTGFPHGSASKESAYSAGDLGSIHGLGRSPGGGKGYPLQYFWLENSKDCMILGVTKSQTRLSDFLFTSLHIYIHIYMCACVYMLSCFSHVWLFVTLWTVARQGLLTMRFSRKEQ